jgi:DNA-binding transcriptional ArsR family regulator
MCRQGERDRRDTLEQQPDRDAVFTALSNRRRRYALSYLLEQDEPVGIKELSKRVAAKENDVPVEDVTHKQRKRVYIALHQNHLAQLEDLGLVECGRSREAIELTDRASRLEPFLDPSVRDTGPTPAVEVGITTVGALLVSLAWFDVYPFALVPDLVYAAGIVAALAVVTGVRLYRARTARAESDS